MPTNRNSSSFASSHLAVSPSFSASLALSRDLIGLIIEGHGTKIVVTMAVTGRITHDSMKDNILILLKQILNFRFLSWLVYVF